MWKTLKEYDITNLHHIKKEFHRCFDQGKLTGISELNAKETIFKKMNVSFIISFCVSKYSITLDTF